MAVESQSTVGLEWRLLFGGGVGDMLDSEGLFLGKIGSVSHFLLLFSFAESKRFDGLHISEGLFGELLLDILFRKRCSFGINRLI